MDEQARGEQRKSLVRFLKRKFADIDRIEVMAEDIVDQAYLRLLERDDGAEARDCFAYLSRVCLNLAYRIFAEMKKRTAKIAEVENLDELPGGADPTAALAEAEAIEAIAASLGALRDIERAIIDQRYYGERSFAEIARSTGIKLNTVLSHHRRALDKLRPRLAAYFNDEADRARRIVDIGAGKYSKFF